VTPGITRPGPRWEDLAARALFGRSATHGERERLGRLPDAQIEEWEGDGHFIHLVDPGRFATRLLTFVEHCDQAG
jgi:pimeloyl-ACP methyl ester carboxylesterase